MLDVLRSPCTTFAFIKIEAMQLIVLSGGSGKLLWPLSNNARSKQFLPLLSNEEGKRESMIQRVVRQIRSARLTDNITFANCKMADIYGTYGWGYSSGGSGAAPTPATGTLANGYKMYNCTNLSGGPMTINNESLAYKLTESEFNEGFNSASQVLSRYSDVNWFQ